LGNKGIVLPRAPSSVFNYAFGLRKLEDLLVDPFLNQKFFHELMEFCKDDVTQIGKKIVAAGGDAVRVIGNVANAEMVSSQFYREYILPYEKQYIDTIAAAGGKVLFHNCGKCMNLLGVYREMLDGHMLESFSTPASGGDIASLKDARKRLGDDIVIVGNFDQVFLLREGTTEDVQLEVHRILEEMKDDCRFIFSTSDSLIPGTLRENIVALAETAIECASQPELHHF